MWGKHVEYRLHEATKKAKKEADAQRKAAMCMKTLMTDPETESSDEAPATPAQSGKFRDPAARMTTKG
jgi:hypothetical protein